MEHFRRQVACHRLQQSEGKVVAAIGKLALALGCETPEIAWSARPFLGGTGLHQAVVFEAAQVTAHHLNRNCQVVGQVAGGGFALAHQHGEGSFSGRGSLSGGSRVGLLAGHLGAGAQG